MREYLRTGIVHTPVRVKVVLERSFVWDLPAGR